MDNKQYFAQFRGRPSPNTTAAAATDISAKHAASDGDGGSDSTQPLACGGGSSDTAQPPADWSDGDGGSDIAQPLASWGSEGAVDFQQWRAAHGYRYYSSCSSSSSEGPEYECPAEYGD